MKVLGKGKAINMKKRKSIFHWWSILADNYDWLWKNNLLYLMCIAPSVICGFLFFRFHAYLFLLLAVAGLILASPGILAFHRTALDAAVETPQTVRARFWGLYRNYFSIGCRLGAVMAGGIPLIGMPIYFALSINNPCFSSLLCLGGMWLLLWLSSSSQVLSFLCTGEKFAVPELFQKVFAPGAIGILFGLMKLAWVYLCILVPTFAVAIALLGLPGVLRFSVLYYLYNQGDENV